MSQFHLGFELMPLWKKKKLNFYTEEKLYHCVSSNGLSFKHILAELPVNQVLCSFFFLFLTGKEENEILKIKSMLRFSQGKEK
jgi:hypothetical protein